VIKLKKIVEIKLITISLVLYSRRPN
jgi:hypothetical protein